MTTKCPFNLLHHHQNPSKSGGGAPQQGTTGTHRIIENYAGGAPSMSRANSAARFIAESINVPVDMITTILNEAPPDDREAVIRMAESLRRCRERREHRP